MRHGRSEQAGDLKAGNITPLLEWTTTSARLMLPRTMCGLRLAWYVLEYLHLLSGMRKLEVGFAAGVSLLDSIELGLEMFEFDGKVSIFIVKVMVVVDLMGKPPIVVNEECITQQLEVCRGAHHEVAEPCQDRECWLHLSLIVVLIIGFCV